MEQFRTEWQEWHDERLADLARPFGWLSVTGLKWLKEGEPDRWDDTPGTFVLDGDWVHFDLAPSTTAGPAPEALDLLSHPTTDTEVRVDSGRLSARVTRNGSLNWIIADSQLFELLNRDGAIGVRRRDSKAPLLSRFVDVSTFDVSRDWVVPARFTVYPDPQKARIATAFPGLEMDEELSGEVTFSLHGEDFTLKTTGCPQTGLSVTFHDYTNGETTPSWRRLSVGVPDPQGNLFVDFNRVVNYPMAFTPYATCPAPVPENLIPLEITAGERRPTQTLSEAGVNTPLLLIDASGTVPLDRLRAQWSDLGLDVTLVNEFTGETLPPSVGFGAVVVVGFEADRFSSEPAQRREALTEVLTDALAAEVSVVAVGRDVETLVSAVTADSAPSQPSMVEREVPDTKLSLAVSADITGDTQFEKIVSSARWSDEAADAAAQDLDPTVAAEQHRATVDRVWSELADRLARMVHVRFSR